MARRQKQLLLDDSFKVSAVHGGEHSLGKRKTARPISTKNPIHLVIRSSLAIGQYSFRTKKHRAFIEKVIVELSQRLGIRIYSYSINSNHIHFVLRTYSKADFTRFLRALTSKVASFVTGAKKGKPLGKGFFDLPAFTRIAEWGKAFVRLKNYIFQNILESKGQITYRSRDLSLPRRGQKNLKRNHSKPPAISISSFTDSKLGHPEVSST